MKYFAYITLAIFIIIIFIIKPPAGNPKVSEAATARMPTVASLANASSPIVPSASAESATGELLSKLADAGLHPAPLGTITKPAFSVPATLIGFGNDTAQIYEYPSIAAATADAQKFTGIYRNVWRGSIFGKSIHLYEKDNVLVYYLGDKENIIQALDKNLVPAF